jgi:uncharacterized protein (DUF2249 family)
MERLLAIWKAAANVLLDVRPDVDHDGEPYIRMMEVAQAIKPGEIFVIIAPFEPIPLYDVLRAQGFLYETQQVAHNEWVVCFSRHTSNNEFVHKG